MTSTSLRPSSHQHPPREPNTAAILSVIPGLGQLYNGETRKGFLFLGVTAINLLVLLLLVFTDSILGALVGFGTTFHIKPNGILVRVIQEAHMGSPVSFICLGLFMSFVFYAIRDAYDHAALIQRRRIYPEYVIEMPEATSGSYIFHFALMISCFILAFFFIVPLPPKSQVTDIEFIENQPPTQKKIVSKRHAKENSENRGEHKKEPVRAPSPAPKSPSKASAPAKPAPTPQPTAKPVPVAHPAPTPTPTPHPSPSPHPTPVPVAHPSPSPSPSPSPHPTPSPSPSPTPSPIAHTSPAPAPMARPSAHPSASPSPSPSPSPIAMAHAGGPTAFAPSPKSGGYSSNFAPSSAPSPISIGSGGGGSSGTPTPVPVVGGGGGGSKSQSHGGGGGAPAPSRVHGGGPAGGGSAGGPIAVAPAVSRPAGGGGGEGVKGNPDEGARPGAPSLEAQKDVDFGPYMADLQRRIKRAWFPPKGNESKKVVVIFKIHRGGELSHLRLDHSSGVAIADQAALKAVENAAPFRPLPPGAPEDVDIQFTFDYNVFGGGGRGVFRQF